MAMAFRGRKFTPEALPDSAPFGLHDTPPYAPSARMSDVQAGMPNVRPSFFGQGGTGRAIAGYLGDALAQAGGMKGVYGATMDKRREDEAALQKAILLAQFKAQNPDPTGTMQNAVAAGNQPGSAGYQQFIRDATMAPRYMMVGDQEHGQSIMQMGGGAPSAPAAPAAPRLTNDAAGHAAFEAMAPGTQFYDPDGNLRQK